MAETIADAEIVISQESAQAPAKEYEDAMIEAFINKPEKTFWYQNAFSKFNINGIDSMKWVWSWWAFFGGWAFLLYRKQYIPALVLFVISILASIIPFGGLILAILAGGFSTYFIYKGYKHKKAEIEASIEDKEKRVETMRAVGGYNQWVVWVYAIFEGILLFIYIFYIFGMMAAVALNN